ncbi:MAG: phosphoglycerate kinase [Coriobacteriaceae bacterium]|nr:phosphoglycerate kinase [Coriobacteriaceae bacterium]MDD6768637.1 phosphoglycerate kinase [Coriobacteriaceae bacterium]
MKNKKTIEDVDVAGKRVLVRVDFNVPLYEGIVMDDTRIREALPTLRYLIEHKARVIIASHLGRPAGGMFESQFSMMPAAMRLIQLLGQPVTLVGGPIAGEQALSASLALKDGEVMMLENLRFNKGEKRNDLAFVRKLAALCDIYVDDAFGASHRAHASIAGVPQFVPAVGGFLLAKEVNTLKGMLENPDRPFTAILGGSKVSDKIGIIDNLIEIADTIIIGGAMCFTFLAAQGHSVGTSKMEDDMVETAKGMIERAAAKGVKLMIPTDVVCADMFAEGARTLVCGVDAIPSDMMGLDIGPETTAAYAEVIEASATVLWNGPMGVFEFPSFEAGTKGVAQAVAACPGETVIGGGDSVAAIKKFGLADQVSFISTGGGASMQLLEGKELPGVAALEDKDD